jgi:hypothetical protein
MIYDKIINNLSEIIGNHKTNENVYNTFIFAKNAIQNKDIALEINPKINSDLDNKMTNSILGGMYFRKNKAGIVSLAFGQKYLDTYNKNSSIHYTILMHEFKHLNDYFLNKDIFFKLHKKEVFKYELNAINIEAEFIKYYLTGNINISKCENYILESYEKDNLDSWTIYNRKESAGIYRFLINMELEYEQKLISHGEIENSLIKKATQLLEKRDQFMNMFDIYNVKESNFSKYGHFIRLKTYEKYLRYILFENIEIKKALFENEKFQKLYKTIESTLLEYDHANAIYSSALDN